VKRFVVYAAMQSFALGLAGTLALLAMPGPHPTTAAASSLQPTTVQAFNAYVAKTEAANADSVKNGPFLWVDGLPPNQRSAAFAKLKAAEVETRRLSVPKSGNDPDIPGALIHDWQAIVFIPGVKLGDVLEVLQDYDHQSVYYAPDVTKSKTEMHNGDEYRIFLQFRRHKVVTVVLNTEHQVTYCRDSATREHSRSSAFRIAQVEDAGGPHEKEKAPGEDDGFLWRMETWWRMEERDGGVYVQNEAVTLTRSIPTGLGWLIEPFITKIPEESLEFTMNATRNAVLGEKKKTHP
jgi:hypothetical protein